MAQCTNSTGVVGIKAMEGPSEPLADSGDDLFADGGDGKKRVAVATRTTTMSR